jgi:hypothetical protein
MAGKGVSVTSYAQITGGNDVFRGVKACSGDLSFRDDRYCWVARTLLGEIGQCSGNSPT